MLAFIRRNCQQLEEKARQTQSFVLRVLYSVLLLLNYIASAIVYTISIIFLPPQRSFAYVSVLDPEQGYQTSYSQHRSFQRTMKIGAVSSLLVVVIMTTFNGVFLSLVKSFASGGTSNISSLTFTLQNTQASATTVYEYNLNVTENILPEDKIWIYFINNDGNTVFTNEFNLEDAQFHSGNINGSFVPDQTVAAGYIQHSDTIAPGFYKFTLDPIVNPGNTITFKAVVSTVGPSLNDDHLTSQPATITPINGDANCSSVTGVEIYPFGINAGVMWDAYSGASDYNIQWKKIGADDSSIQRAQNITDTKYLIQGLSFSTEYQVQVQALGLSSCPQAPISEWTEVTTTKDATEKNKYTKSKVLKKKLTNKSAIVNWVVNPFIQSVTVQVFQGKQTKAALSKKVASTKTSLKVKKLKPGTVYRVRVQATYSTGEKSGYSKYTTFKTKK